MRSHVCLCTIAVMILSSGLAFAAEDANYELTKLGNRVPSKQELIDALKIKPPLPTRSGEPAPPPKPRAVSSAIGFEFNSAVLNDKGKEFLNNLGAALSDEALNSARLLLEGHTDAVGGEEYNLELSKKRAAAVQAFLSTVWGVPGDHLSIVGKGKADLLDPDHPDSADNRAVVIVNTGLRNENQ